MPATAVLSAALASRSERSPFLSSSFCFPRRIKKKGRKESVESGPRRPISDDDQISPIKPLIGVKSLIWSELHAGLDDYLLSDNKMRQCGNLILPVAPRIESHHSSRPFLFLHGRNDRVGSDDSSSSKQKQLRARKGSLTRQIKNYIFVCTCFFYMLSNSLGENARETGSSSNNDRDSIPDLFIFKVSVYVQIGRRETGRKKKRRQGKNLIKLMVSVVFTRSSDDFFFSLSPFFFTLAGLFFIRNVLVILDGSNLLRSKLIIPRLGPLGCLISVGCFFLSIFPPLPTRTGISSREKKKELDTFVIHTAR